MNQPTENLTVSKSLSWKMFNDISPRYDLLNRVLSFGLDIQWRNRLAALLPTHNNLHILDLATGTADVLLTICRKNPNVTKAYGIDLAEKMLEVGREKIARQHLTDKITLKHADATNLPFENNQFDTTTISFGIRNIPDPEKAIREMYRVLKPGGKSLILEFSLPKNAVIRFFHLFYLRYIVPLIGGLLTGHFAAYTYLNKTIETFPHGEGFTALLTKNGFKNVHINELLFGTASIYIGEKQ